MGAWVTKSRSANAGIVLHGFTELELKLKGLPIALQKRVLTQATQKAMKPVVSDARDQLSPGHGLDTGALKKSIGIKTKRMRFAAFTVVGPRTGFHNDETGRDPVRYAHLVEFGHTYQGMHVPPMPFMRPAFDKNVPHILMNLREALASGVIRYASVRGGKAA